MKKGSNQRMGKLFFFEGPDGSGKTIMSTHLFDIIREEQEYFPYLFTFPNKNAFGYDKIKDLSNRETNTVPTDIVQSLFIINMIESFEENINDIIENYPNSLVLIDRSLISTFIYNKKENGILEQDCIDFIHKTTGLNYNEVDFDIISKVITHSIVAPTNIFFIMPPLEILLKHSKERIRNGKAEKNDKEEIVKKTYELYKTAYDYYKKKAKNPNEFVMLDEWDMSKSEDENYSKMSETILNTILYRKI